MVKQTLREKIAKAIDADFYAIYRGDKSFNDTADAILDVIRGSVEPLPVKNYRNGGRAKCPNGRYSYDWYETRHGKFNVLDTTGGMYIATGVRLDTAKSAAQTDYTSHILSALGIVGHNATPS